MSDIRVGRFTGEVLGGSVETAKDPENFPEIKAVVKFWTDRVYLDRQSLHSHYLLPFLADIANVLFTPIGKELFRDSIDEKSTKMVTDYEKHVNEGKRSIVFENRDELVQALENISVGFIEELMKGNTKEE